MTVKKENRRRKDNRGKSKCEDCHRRQRLLDSKLARNKALEDFSEWLLEKEMLIAQEMSCPLSKVPDNHAYSWISYIRGEFKKRFLSS